MLRECQKFSLQNRKFADKGCMGLPSPKLLISSHHCHVEMNGKNLPHLHRANKSNFKEEKEEHEQIHEV